MPESNSRIIRHHDCGWATNQGDNADSDRTSGQYRNGVRR